MVASSKQHRDIKAAHQQLRSQVTELILLSHSADNNATVLPQFVSQLVEAIGAQRAGLWSFNTEGALECTCMHHLAGIAAETLAHLDDSVLMQVAASETGGVVIREDTMATRTGIASPTPQTVIVVPIQRQGKPWGVLEVTPSLDFSDRVQHESLAFVRHMARVLSHRMSRDPAPLVTEDVTSTEFLRVPSRLPPQSKPSPCSPNKRSQNDKLNEVILSFHESLDLETTALIIVNEFRQALHCSRVSIVVAQGSSFRILAVSGQETINRRADVVRQIEELARLARRNNAPQWLERDSQNIPAELAEFVEQHGAYCNWQHLGVIPLRNGNDPTQSEMANAILVVEQMEPANAIEMANITAQLAAHAARAITNAVEQQRLFLLPLWKHLGRARSTLSKTSPRKITAIAGTLLFIVSLLTFLPMSFHVVGQGTLQPAAQRDVFADVAGVVTAIHVEHGDLVKQGDVLLELRNTDLDVQIADILGKRSSAQEQLSSIQRMRHVDQIPREEENRLTGQVLQLQEQLKGLDQQHRLLLEKQKRLIVRSPMSGQVSTWNVHRQLMLRPVAPGQILLTIADSSGPWNLEVYLPENEAGHLLSAKGARGQNVQYLVTSHPTLTHTGKLSHIDAAAQLYEEHGHALRMLIIVDKHDLPDTPAGTTATVRIQCGHKSIGYVWLHRLVDFVHSHIWFPLF